MTFEGQIFLRFGVVCDIIFINKVFYLNIYGLMENCYEHRNGSKSFV